MRGDPPGGGAASTAALVHLVFHLLLHFRRHVFHAFILHGLHLLGSRRFARFHGGNFLDARIATDGSNDDGQGREFYKPLHRDLPLRIEDELGQHDDPVEMPIIPEEIGRSVFRLAGQVVLATRLLLAGISASCRSSQCPLVPAGCQVG